MDTVLVNGLKTVVFLSHAYVATNRLIIADIHSILKYGFTPNSRHGLEAKLWEGLPYWKF